jgi:hypothetical protein
MKLKAFKISAKKYNFMQRLDVCFLNIFFTPIRGWHSQVSTVEQLIKRSSTTVPLEILHRMLRGRQHKMQG